MNYLLDTNHWSNLQRTNDMWIAATALAHDCIVVGSDAHFLFVDGLNLENWIEP
jgi:predicted nucleic acid-binding protein